MELRSPLYTCQSYNVLSTSGSKSSATDPRRYIKPSVCFVIRHVSFSQSLTSAATVASMHKTGGGGATGKAEVAACHWARQAAAKVATRAAGCACDRSSAICCRWTWMQ